MCEKGIPDLGAAFDALERDVLYLLTDPDRYQPVWSVQEIAREVETTDPMALIRPLMQAGLVHRTSDGFVFATRAAVRMVQMVGHVI
jgi:hypothetical protein